jgi:hypothetical protein
VKKRFIAGIGDVPRTRAGQFRGELLRMAATLPALASSAALGLHPCIALSSGWPGAIINPPALAEKR